MNRIKFTTNLDDELLEKLKIEAIKEKRDVNEILEELIKKYLDSKGGDNMDQKTLENKLRRVASKHGEIIKKSRKRSTEFDYHDQGGYMIVDAKTNGVVAGANFDLDLDDIRKHYDGEE